MISSRFLSKTTLGHLTYAGPAQAELNYNNDSQPNGQTEGAAQESERQDGVNASPERRERRSRDRYGRDRRERNPNADNLNDANSDSYTDANSSLSAGEHQQAEGSTSEGQTPDVAPVTRSYFDRTASVTTPASVNTPAQTASSPETPSAAKQSASGLPKVKAFELPIASLVQVAESSGLQWVNSDPAKIAQVQAAIAAEPKPVHVPRVRPPAVVLDEGPLVLVETRKDLSEMKLPF
jgi:ribonuclease E